MIALCVEKSSSKPRVSSLIPGPARLQIEKRHRYPDPWRLTVGSLPKTRISPRGTLKYSLLLLLLCIVICLLRYPLIYLISLFSVMPYTSQCVTPSVSPRWESLHRSWGGWTNRAPLHWGETEWRQRTEEEEEESASLETASSWWI